MKIIIGISTFSFNKSHFQSFDEIKQQFASLKALQGNYQQHGVSLSLATDILDNKWAGPSITEQLRNFSYGTDKQVISAFRNSLHRKYLNGFKKNYTSSELEVLACNEPNTAKLLSGILYIPNFLFPDHQSFNDQISFERHYEDILGHYPIDNKSFYARATSHFTNLIYHSECAKTLDRVTDGFINYSVAFVTCLKALNEFSPTEIISTRDKVKIINSSTPYDCSGEGNSHPNFKFSYTYNDTQFRALNCEYHIKPSKNNNNGDRSFHQKRLYFGFIPVDNNKWKVAIAAIGPHISTHSGDRYAAQKRK